MTYTLIIAGQIFMSGLTPDGCRALQAQAVFELHAVRASAIVCAVEREV